MKFKNKLVFLTVFLFLIIFSSGIVFAEDSALPSVETGEVSGDVEIASVAPFASKVTSEELVYEIPANVSEIKSVYAVVSTYSGSGNYSYGLTTNISLKTANTTEVLEYANLTFVNNTANDPVVYPITDFTTKQYSDYQTLIDITDKVKDLSSADTITISVNNTALEGYEFDGRIKLIALIFAYDDNDNDKISYWLNIGQAWTKGTLTTVFNTKDFDDDYIDVTLDSISVSSKDAIYTLNGELLSNPIQNKSSMYIYDKWSITDNFELNNDTKFTYDGNGSSYKAVIQLLKIITPEYVVSASIAPEYSNTIYAGVNNTLKITVNNGNKKLNGTVQLLIGNEEIASSDLVADPSTQTELTLIDTTIRPITAKTVNGNYNEKVHYTLNILDNKDNILYSTNVSYVILYDGYLGKDYEYPGAEPLLREIIITGDVIVLNTAAYSAGGDTNRTDVYNVDLANGTVNTALLYVSYNWDKNIDSDFNSWNTTFNNQTIAPIASYRDQSNLGTGNSARYGYGLVVYDVTALLIDGNNTFEFTKISGNAAVYPSNLIVLTNNDESTFKTVYILEEADLLYKTYNKNLPTGFNTAFEIVDGNATLYVFAASAQAGEGNIIVNNETYSDVWSGTTKSFDTFNATVNGTDISIYFEATGGTILGLHQMVIVESDLVSVSSALKPEYANTVYAGVENTLTLTVTNDAKSLKNITVKVLVNGEEIDSFVIDSLATGANNVTAVVDSTIRPVTAQTVNGNDNEKVNYTVIIEDAQGNVISQTNSSFTVLYDGYLGKDYEYPGAEPFLREIVITGDVIVLNTAAYSAGGATNRTDVYNVDLDNGTVNTALLYVSYNWDKNVDSDFNSWNTTFNNQTIAPIASYRDQSNLGTGNSARYGYGLVVYDVTALLIDGKNTFEFTKISGNAAVYPSNLIVLTDKNDSIVKSNVYILEEADLLYKTYNKNLATGFNTTFEIVDGNATLVVFAAGAQAGEGNIIVNNETYTDVWSGTSQSFDIFVADVYGTDISIYFESTGGTILGLHQMIVVESPFISMSSALKPEYSNTVYAGVENTLTLTVTNDAAPAENVTVKVLVNGEEIDSYVIDSLASGANNVTAVVDSTIRPVTAQTVNGNDNEKVNYTVIIEDAQGNVISQTNSSFTVLYNGYLGKDYEYPGAEPLLREILITGDVIVLNTAAYSAGGATNRTDVFNVDLANGTVNTALLYVSYNWDKNADSDFNSWNTTFNGQVIAPVASYRDQSNLGTGNSARYGYGLVVYDVSDLVVDGNNTFEFTKISGNAAVYPSNLIVLTDKNGSAFKTAYILEEADLLYKTYNKNLATGFNTSFEIVDGNATLYVFAAGAQAGEGNIIVNNETYTDVWSGTSQSFDTFTATVNGTDISIYFESTGGTILGLHQMIVVEHEDYVVINAPDVEKYYKGSERFIVTVTNCQGNPLANKTVNITINGVTYTRTSDENGTASMALGLNSGEYNVTTTVDNATAESVVTILPTVNGTDVVKVFRNATQYYATFLDSEGNYLANGTAVQFNINGVMYTRYINGSEGKARLNINLAQGTYIITAINPNNTEMSTNNITVLPNIVDNNDLVKYYKNDSQYYVTILGDDGNPVGANETVTFNINGVMYERKTNENGTARLNINLQPGEYVITAMYNGCNVANNITVLPVLNASDIKMTYKDGTQFKATLVDGQGNPLANATVTFNINGVFYDKTTDVNGTAALNINLMPGEYIITSSYNGTNIANTIKIDG